MIRKIVAVLMVFCAVNMGLTAQETNSSDLVFDKMVHDFGDFLLSDGKKSCTFTYTNKGTKPIVIQTIVASCGCTQPTWDKAPLMPGRSGTITVTYLNDQGPYPFDKTMMVYSTATDRPITLRIRGVVHEKAKSVSELFPIAYGPLRMRSIQYQLGQIAQGETKTDSVQVINGGRSSIEIGFTNVSKGLVIKASPSTLKSGEKGYIRYTVDTRLHTDWGALSYSAHPTVNGRPQGAVPLEILADIRDNFTHLTHEQLADAPILLAEQTSARFSNARQGSVIKNSFNITNRGKSPIIFHKATPSHDYTTVDLPKEIAPGKSGMVTVSVNSARLIGEVVTGVTIVTNVPTRPVFALMVAGTVVP
ncbi:MAG: DUF1573 domain-containing protein [Bacteroidales bacterium]|nr:DUF1573 domain-containing protein [Bacteroidales bacterium]